MWRARLGLVESEDSWASILLCPNVGRPGRRRIVPPLPRDPPPGCPRAQPAPPPGARRGPAPRDGQGPPQPVLELPVRGAAAARVERGGALREQLVGDLIPPPAEVRVARGAGPRGTGG